MSEEEKKVEKKHLTLEITLPTADDIKEALVSLFPGIKVKVKSEEKPSEKVAEESTSE